jgi:type IV pilus assembly protein PilY1
VFGNGYGSTNHRAVLYFVDIADGSLIRKIDLGANDPVSGTAYSNTYPNGLATPSLYDHNGDKIIDTVYAGDLQGNLWKFDVSHASNTSLWESAFKSGSDPKPLFTTRNASDQAQPITSPVEIGAPPAEKKDAYNKVVMLYFGTGKYFATDDEKADGPSSTYVTQSVYGILDTGSRITATNRADLQQQTIIYQGVDLGSGQRSATTYNVRATSNNAVSYASKRGWYMDLVYDDSDAGTDDKKGERVISIPLIRSDRVVFTTMIPSSNPCEFGGTSWLTELSATTGARLDYSAFDMNNDDGFDSKDYVALASGSVPISSIQSTVGIIKSPSVIGAGSKEYKLSSGTTGNLSVLKEKAIGGGGGRVSWQEIIGD